MTYRLIRASVDFPGWNDVVDLLNRSFDYMTPILGHPPRAMTVDPATLTQAATVGSAFIVMFDGEPVACLFTRASRDMNDALYCGWLAVCDRHRGQGLARALFDAAKKEARSNGFDALTLDTGRSLVALHQLFANLGFSQLPGSKPVVSFRKPIPRRMLSTDPQLSLVLDLLRRAFAYMEGRIDPPSSLGRMTLDTLQTDAANKELWVAAINRAPAACMILTPKSDTLYLGKLATDPTYRRSGLARILLSIAEERAHQLQLPSITLQTRVELTENHTAFRALGFQKNGESAHPGFDRPTSFTFAKHL